MIERRHLDALILASIPSLAHQWREIAEDEVTDGERSHYATAGAVAHHIVMLYKAERADEVQRAFDMIERLHLEGDPYVRELATIGYLEDLQNVIDRDDGVDREQLEVFLGPESRRWWRGVDAFWQKGEVPVRPVDD